MGGVLFQLWLAVDLDEVIPGDGAKVVGEEVGDGVVGLCHSWNVVSVASVGLAIEVHYIILPIHFCLSLLVIGRVSISQLVRVCVSLVKLDGHIGESSLGTEATVFNHIVIGIIFVLDLLAIGRVAVADLVLLFLDLDEGATSVGVEAHIINGTIGRIKGRLDFLIFGAVSIAHFVTWLFSGPQIHFSATADLGESLGESTTSVGMEAKVIDSTISMVQRRLDLLILSTVSIANLVTGLFPVLSAVEFLVMVVMLHCATETDSESQKNGNIFHYIINK